MDAIDADVEAELAEALEFARSSPAPPPEAAFTHLFHEPHRRLSLPPAVRSLTYLEALNEALVEEMERDESVFLMGEDVSWGLMGATAGLAGKFRRGAGARHADLRGRFRWVLGPAPPWWACAPSYTC